MRKRSRSVGAYEVGYGKPPAHTRFEKGRSGNPKGTPKGGWPKPNRELERIEKILGRTVTVRNGDTAEAMKVLDAAYLAQGAKAARGDLKALVFLVSRLEAAALEALPLEATVGDDDLAIINNYLARTRGAAGDQGHATADQAGGAPNPAPPADQEE